MRLACRHVDRRPLNIPIVAFDGRTDHTIERGNMVEWQRYTTGPFQNVPIDGDHYFVSTQYRQASRSHPRLTCAHALRAANPAPPLCAAAQVTDVVTQECLELVERFRGGILGEGHSWVAAPPAAAEPDPAQMAAEALPDEEAAAPAPTTAPSHDAQQQTAADVESQILAIAREYVEDVNLDQPLAAQGLDSLASMEMRHKVQAATGVELLSLIEDPQGATLRQITREATAALQQQQLAAGPGPAPGAAAPAPAGGQAAAVVRRAPRQLVGPLWVSPAPVSVKMRLFCLPYAGGVSENVYARWAGRRGGCGVGSTPGF